MIAGRVRRCISFVESLLKTAKQHQQYGRELPSRSVAATMRSVKRGIG